MQVLNWLSTGSDSIPVSWPRVANGTDAITYDVIRMTTAGGIEQNLPYPYNGGCPGGSGGTCGYVAKGLTQAVACAGGLVCSYTDTGSSSTSTYTIEIGDYAGNLAFWPGSLVSVNKSVRVDAEVNNRWARVCMGTHSRWRTSAPIMERRRRAVTRLAWRA